MMSASPIGRSPSFVDLELMHVRGRQRGLPRNSRRAIVGLPLTRNGDRVAWVHIELRKTPGEYRADERGPANARRRRTYRLCGGVCRASARADRRETGTPDRNNGAESRSIRVRAKAGNRGNFPEDTCVSCPTCSCEIPLAGTLHLRGQFSVPWLRCQIAFRPTT